MLYKIEWVMSWVNWMKTIKEFESMIIKVDCMFYKVESINESFYRLKFYKVESINESLL